MPTFEESRAGYTNLWGRVTILTDRIAAADKIVQRIIGHKASDYQPIEAAIGVPWFLVGCLHYRESDLNFSTYLGNGDPLDRPTVHVPAGRGPFASFAAGASDALRYQGFDKIAASAWDAARCLYSAEEFNGFGYYAQGINSPYVWSWSNLYGTGKYVADGQFDANAVDQQCGVAVLLQRLCVADASVATRLAVTPTVTPLKPTPVSSGPLTEDALAGIIAKALRAAADAIDPSK